MPESSRAQIVSGIRVTIFPDRETAESAAADRIAGLLSDRARRGLSVVLGLATGSTPIGIYRRLVAKHRARELSFAHVETFNLDEYLPIGRHDPGSFHRFMHEHLFDHVDLPRGKRHVPNGTLADSAIEAHAAEYETAIRAAGGIDLQILGIGRNGHIGFNEPGSSRDTRTRRVDLAPETIEANRPLFPRGVDPPRAAITMGIATILESRRVLALAFGAAKAEIVRATLSGPISPAVPATFLREHGPPPEVDLFLDEAAASGLNAAPA